MGFTEMTFLFLFLPISIILYFMIDRTFHNINLNNVFLIILSIVLYAWISYETLLIFLLITAFTYAFGYAVVNNKKRIAFPILAMVGILSFYKFGSYVFNWANSLLSFEIIKGNNFVMPIGISFIIFEAISYIVDIYRGDAKPGTLIECLLYLSLFPKLVSGPIVLWRDFKPQTNDRKLSMEQIENGIDRIIIGYAKKCIIADTFGGQIAIINNGISSSGADIPTMWLRSLLYFFQIYYDFSGYSDIAIGICKVFGFSFKENFNFPYLSKSIAEFWHRWHISLGSWFREYIYIPLGGNRRGNVYINLIIVFVLTGIWHGFGWQFLAWGGYMVY